MPDKASGSAQPEKLSIGQMLRQQREERSLTPEQAADQSKVPLCLLLALESDDYHTLPDPAYLIRLLHDYALLLRLDPKVLEADFKLAIRRPPGMSLAVAVPPKSVPAPIPWKHVLWSAVAILVVTPLVFIALSLASKRAADHAPPPESQAPMEATGSSGDQPSAASLGTVRPGITAPAEPDGDALKVAESGSPPEATAAASPPPQAEVKPQRFLLSARASAATWMAVRADDGQVRRILLQKGEVARFSADTHFVVTVGNAGGVELLLNGKPVSMAGASGEVIRNLILPPPVTDLGSSVAQPSATGPVR